MVDLKPDAIILAGHMGLKRQDDYANQVGALTREFPELVLFLGGHTHVNHPGEIMNNVLYTQADHYGIYVGKVDLTFDRVRRRLLQRKSITVPMDGRIPLDPLVLSLTRKEIDIADQTLAREIGELTETLDVASSVGEPSDVERLIGSAMIAALRKQGCEVDAVVHGLFDPQSPLLAGIMTVANAWDVLPYENQIVTIDVTRDELISLAQDFGSGRDLRNVMGMRVIGSRQGNRFVVQDLRAANDSPLPVKMTYRIALNSYDSQSGGQRFETVARIVQQSSSHRMFYSIQIRDALIDFFVTRQKVGKASLLV